MKELRLLLLVGCLMSTQACSKMDTAAKGPTGADSVKPASEIIEDDCSKLRHLVNITSVENATSFGEARDKFDKQLGIVRQFVSTHHFKHFGLISLDYGLNDLKRAQGGKYKLRASYMVDSQEDAFTLGDYLSKKKVNVSLVTKNPCNANDTPED